MLDSLVAVCGQGTERGTGHWASRHAASKRKRERRIEHEIGRHKFKDGRLSMAGTCIKGDEHSKSLWGGVAGGKVESGENARERPVAIMVGAKRFGI